MIRLNTTTDQFEGYNSSWLGLGGVIDIDQDTYVSTEKTSDDDTLFFYTAGGERAKIDNAGNTFVAGDLTISGSLAVSGDFTLGDTTTDKITTRGDLYVEDDAFFADAVEITGSLTVDGTASAATPTQNGHLTTKLYVDSADNTLTTNLATSGTTLQNQITSNDSDITALNTATGSLQTQVTSNDSDISTLTTNLAATGSNLQTQVTSNDSDISTLTTNLAATGSNLQTQVTNLSGDAVLLAGNQTIAGNKTFSNDITILGGLAVSGDFTLGDATTDKITTRGDLYVEDDAVFSDTIRVTGDAYFAGDVGIGTATPSVALDISATDAIKIPVGTTVQRPTAADGLMRLNTTTNQFEGYQNSNWQGLGGVIDVDQDTYVSTEKTSDDDTLFFYTAGSEKARLTSGGLFGIGTASPDSLLEVSSATHTKIKSTAVGDYFPRLGIERTNGSSKTNYQWEMEIGSGGFLNFKDNTNSYYPLIFNTGGDLYLGNDTSGANPTMFIDQSSGEVGIGTSAPAKKLHVKGDYIRNESSSAGVYSQMDGDGFTIYRASSNCYLNFPATSSNLVVRGPSYAEFMRVTAGGLVGIGTASPATKLHLADGSDVYLTLESTHASTTEEVAVKYSNYSTGSYFWWQGLNQEAHYSLAFGDAYSGANVKFKVQTDGNVLVASGSTILYGDGDALFSGAAANMNWDKSDSALEFQDNAKIKLGTGDDLQIYHDGSNSIITDQGTGGLKIMGSSIYIRSDSDEDMIFATSNGAVNLYYDNALKLETTSTGVTVTGLLTATTSLVTSTANFNGSYTNFGGGSGSSGASIESNGRITTDHNIGIGTTSPDSNLDIEGVGSPELRVTDTTNTVGAYIQSNDTKTIFGSRTNHPVQIEQNAGAALYIDTSKNVGIGTTAPSDKLEVRGDVRIGNETSGYIRSDGNIYLDPDADSVNIYDNASAKILNVYNAAAVGVRLHSNGASYFNGGSVGIGTTTPSVQLQTTGDVIVGGNLTVSGTTFTVDTSNVLVEDPVLLLAKNQTGGAALDAGFLIERGSDTNVGFIWDESADQFAVINTTEIADDNDITIASYAAFKAGVGTFTGVVTANAGINIDNINIDGTTLALSSGDLTIDVAGNISLDADGNNITLKDGGIDYGNFTKSSNDFVVQSTITNGDILFKGSDGGSAITALSLNMSEAGEATFNSDVFLKDNKNVRWGDGQDFRISFDGSNAIIYNAAANSDVYFKGNNGSQFTALTLDMSDAGTAIFNHDITLPDNGRAVFGAGSDLQIYHDGTNSYIDNASTYLILESDNIILRNNAGTEDYAKFLGDGAVNLYYNNALKLETTATGVSVTGQLDLSSHLDMPDNAWIKLGASDDLLITHDGSSSWIIDNGAGGLVLASDSLYIKNAAYNETGLSFIENGAVTLFYDNVAKIATTSTGVDITGHASMTTGSASGKFAVMSASVHGSYDFYNNGTTYLNGSAIIDDALSLTGANAKLQLPDNGKALFGAGDDLKIYHDGSNSRITNATGSLWLQSDTGIRLTNLAVTESMAAFYHNGAVELYYDGTKKLETAFTGVSVTGLLTSTTATFAGTVTQTTGDLLYSGGGNWDLKHTVASQNIVFSTTPAGGSATSRMRITHDGKVGIGTDAPTSKLQILGNASTNGLSIKSAGNGGTYPFRVTWSGGTEGDVFCIDDNLRVGIGTTAPAYKLEVKASVTGNWLSRIYNTATTSNPSGLLVRIDDADSTGTILGVNNNGAYHMVVKGDGKVGIGTTTPSTSLDISATDAIKVPVGTTAQRPTAANGMIRLNTTTDQFEGYNSSWLGLGGVIDIDQDTYVSTEKTSDDDTLFFYTAGAERAKIDNAGNVHVANNLTISGNLAVSGDFTLGDATTDKITTKGDLYVEDDAVFSDTIRVTGDAYFAGDVGIGTATPSVSLDIVGTDAIKVPAGTDAQRPSAAEGLIRLNTDSDRFEGYNDGNWHALGQGTGNLTSDVYAANGVASGFALSATPNTDKDVLVSVGGVVQTPTTNYVVNSSTLNFTSIPPSGVEIEARHLNVGFIHYDDQTIPGDKTFPDDITILGNLSVSGDFTLGDATTDKITTRGDLYVEDDAFFSDQVQVETDQIIKGGAVRDGSWHRGLEITTENANYASLFFGNQQTTKYSAIVWASSTSGNTGNKRGAQLYAQPTSTANTDLRFDTNNAVGTSNPTLKMLIRGDGKVGIGTDAPDVRFHVQTSVADVLSKFINTDGTNGHGLLIKAGGSASGKYIATFRDAANNTRMHLLADGKVGIGTAAPGKTLDVNGDIRIRGDAGKLNFYRSTSPSDIAYIQYNNGASRLDIAANNKDIVFMNENGPAESMRIKSDGKVGIGTTAPATPLHVYGSGDILKLQSSSVNAWQKMSGSTGFSWQMGATANGLQIYSDETSSYIAVFKKDGNVGIGETSPDMRLHVKDTLNTAYSVTNAVLEANNLFKLENASTTANAFAGMQFRVGSGCDLFFGAEQKTGNDGDFYFANQGSPSVELMRIKSSGNVQIASGSTILYGDGDALFSGSAANMSWDKSDSALEFQDNAKIKLGTGDDLQIYHDGGNSYVSESGTGALVLQSNGTAIVLEKTDGENMILANTDGAVTLYYNGSAKLATTSTGVNITGQLSATTKSFLIDHPTKPGKKLRHGSLEGPENGVYIRGKGKTAIIELPEYWTKLIDEDSITVQLTPIGKHQHIYVEKIDNNTVYIQSDEARKNVNDLNYYYLILAERIDVEKLQIEE